MNKIQSLKEKGFFHIFGSSVLNKIIQFCSGIFIVKILTKNEFGIFTYSQNLISFFLLINGFGILNGLLQFGTKNIDQNKKKSLVKYTIIISFISNIFICISIILYAKFGIFKIVQARKIFLFMSFYPITNILVEIIQVKNRIDLENKKMALNTNINTTLNLLFMIILGKVFGIKGIIIGKYLANIITVILGISSIKMTIINWKKIKILDKKEKKNILKFSLVAMINNGISQLLYIIDIFLVGIMVGNIDIIASYKTATLIPFALNFIPLSVMTYMYPYFSRYSENKEYLKGTYKKLLRIMICFNFIITLSLLLLSKNIIILIFGEKYLEALNSFRILSIGYFFASTFRIPAGNLLAAIGAIKFNFYTTIICGILNIILDLYLIKNYGAVGAAIATLLIFIFSGIMGNLFIYNQIYENKFNFKWSVS